MIAVGVWNFVGADVFGFLINLPVVSYFEVGTLLTPNHGHAAMMGVFGMLAVALIVLAIRRAGGEMLFNPPAEAVIHGGDYLVVMGDQENLHVLEQRLAEVQK